MAKNYDSFWIGVGITHGILIVVYVAIFHRCFGVIFEKRKQSAKMACLFATNFISTIHCVVVIIGYWISFVTDKLYQESQYIVSEPGVLAYIYVAWCSYMLADGICLTFCSIKYPKQCELRRDVLTHHCITYLYPILLEIPTPINVWGLLALSFLAEVSTVALNLQWFVKHEFITNSKFVTLQNCRIAFIVTWFGVRIPVFWLQLGLTIYLWDKIFDQVSLFNAIVSVACGILLNVLQFGWSVLICRKFAKFVSKKKRKAAKYVNIENEEQVSVRNDTEDGATAGAVEIETIEAS